MIETHGDPLGTIRRFINTVWEKANVDSMLVPINGSSDLSAHPSLIDNPEQLDDVNPFKPLMQINAANLVPNILKENPEKRIAIIFRPCEMRALMEMTKHDNFSLEQVLSICIDCLGTIPAEDFQWRSERKETTEKLTKEALQFAKQGGIVHYRYRSACQICSTPEANGADVNINVLGIPVRQYILVNAQNDNLNGGLHLNEITDGEAEISLLSTHNKIVARITQRNHRTFERVTHGLEEVLPSDVNSLVSQLEACGSCQTCLDVCPICEVDRPSRDQDGHYNNNEVMRWMISCAGCGMCEQSCPNNLPLSVIFGHIREQLSKEWSYTPGVSVEDTLPMM
jgi:formate dehydrogenase subunit beta